MKNITELLAIYGGTIPEDKAEAFNKDFNENYKTIADWQNQKDNAKKFQEELKTAKETLESLKDVDPTQLNKDIETLKTTLENNETAYKKQLAEMEFDNLLREKLHEEKLIDNDYIKKGIFNEIKSKGLQIDNGVLLGYDDVIKAIKEKTPTAFVTEDNNPHKLITNLPAGNTTILPSLPTAKTDLNAHRIIK